MSFVIVEGDVVLRSSGGVEMATEDGVAVVANARGFIGVGFDGTNTRFIRVNSSGQQIIVGAGTAGTPAGGVVSVQGVSGGQALPISAASLPLPTGAATEATLATLLTEATFTARVPVLATSGGTEAAALRVTIANDSTGLVSVDDNGGSLTVDTPQLPAALVGGRLDVNNGAWFGSTAPTVGQKAMASSIPVVVASNQSAIPVSQSGTWTVQQGTPPWSVVGPGASGAALSGNPVRVAGSDGTNTRNLLTDTSGRPNIVGAAADGAAVAGNPVLTAGQDGTNVQSFKTDTTGRQEVIGGAADGAAPAGNPVLVAGQDGTNVQSLKTDTEGRPEAVGAAANGVAVAGAPIRVGGSDGTLTRDILTDTGGRQVVVGAAADGATPVGNPVLGAGFDGTNVQTTLTDTAGRHRVVGAAATGAAVAGDPVRIAGSDGTLTRDLLTDTGGRAIAVLSDGTNGPVAVKAASTAPVVGDRALVVVLSPNQQAIPVTTTPATSTAGLSFGTIALGGGSSGSLNAIRATTYNEQTTGAQRSMSSSSTRDTSAGTGARTVEITYYTSTGAGPFTETVTLNGTTAVNTVATNICFIERMVVTTVGSGGANAGTITLFVGTGGGGGTLGTIGVGTVVSGVGDGRTLWAHHYIPPATSCSITGLAVGASQQAVFHLKARPIGVANASERIISGLNSTTAAFQRSFGSPVVIGGPARFVVYGVPSTNGVTLNASVDFFETPA